MSVTIDYFFNSEKSPPELAAEINLCLGCSFTKDEDEVRDKDAVFYCVFLGMGLWLSECRFENDGECNYEDYRYHLNTRTRAGDADLRIVQIPATTVIAYSLFRRLGIVGMLVFDGQTLLARYEQRINSELDHPELFDLVSSEVVTFPRHFDVLSKRAPEDFGELAQWNNPERLI